MDSLLTEHNAIGILVILFVIALLRIRSQKVQLRELYDQIITALESNTTALEAQNNLMSARIVTAEVTTDAITKIGFAQESAIARFSEQLTRIENYCIEFNRIVNPRGSGQ